MANVQYYDVIEWYIRTASCSCVVFILRKTANKFISENMKEVRVVALNKWNMLPIEDFGKCSIITFWLKMT